MARVVTAQRPTSRDLQVLMRRFPHLSRYLNSIVPRLGWPNYYGTEVPRDLRKASFVNIMYTVDTDVGIFIHIYMPPEGTESGYRKYVVVEPDRPPKELFYLVEEKLATIITENDVARDIEERKKILLDKLKIVIEPVNYQVDYKSLLAEVYSLARIPVYRGDLDNLFYYMLRDKTGLGILEPLLKDPYIEDISCPGVGYIYIVHKVFGPLETSLRFDTPEELDRFIIQLSERIGKQISHARPIVDATLPDGSRINMVFGTDVSLQGSNFTIRRVSKIPLSVIQLVNWNTFDEKIAAYLWILLLEGSSGMVSGETASGKTTTLNAIVAFINPTYKIVTIEDTAELNIPHNNWVRELTRDTGSPETSVTMFDLLKAALRQRPNYIIVGEIRGAEGNIAFQAMQSVSWDTPILVRSKTTGETKLVPIGAFVDQFYKDDEEGTPKYIENYEILSMDRYGRVKWSRINYVLRHKASEVYEIMYEGKGIIKTTGSHSVFVLDEDSLEIRPKLVSDLREGDLLVTFVKRSLEDTSTRTLIDIYKTLLSTNISRIRLIDEDTTQTSNSNPLPKTLELDNDLAYLLGVYLADGCVEAKKGFKNPTLVFSLGSSEKEITRKVSRILEEKLNVKPHTRDRGTYILLRVHNAPLSYSVSKFCGSKLGEKHIPMQLWRAKPDTIKSFLEGYTADAKRTNIRAGIVVYTTKNRKLAVELTWLARIAGLESKIFRNSGYYDIHIRLYGRGRIRPWSEKIPLKPIAVFLEKKKLEKKLPLRLTYIISRFKQGRQRFITRATLRKILEFLEKYSDMFNEKDREFLDRLRVLIQSDVAFLRVLKIKKIPYSGYVYDISVPETELFLGGEIPIALHNTGHPVLATFHAASVERLVQRITSPPINVPKTQLDNLNFVLIQSAVYREGVLVRRVLSVNEIIGYDTRADSILYVPVFTWDPVRDIFTFRGKGTSYLLEEKIGVRRGLSRRNMFLIYEELDVRARIIKKLIEKKVFNYYQVFNTLAKIYSLTVEYARKASKEEAPYAIIEALEDALKRIERGELVK